MASSGREFITFLNESMASSASTYAKSEAGQRAEIQKELDKTDRQILSLQRLLRSPSSRSSSKVALGSLTQLLTSETKLQTTLRDDIQRETEKAEGLLDKLKDKNDALWATASAALDDMDKATGDDSIEAVQAGKASSFVAGLGVPLNKLDDESRVLAYAMIAKKVADSNAPQKAAILAEINKATSAFLTDQYPSESFAPEVDPAEWAMSNAPPITEDTRAAILSSPDLQRRFLKKSITTTKPNDAFIEELRGLIRTVAMGGDISGSASAAAAIQVAEVDAPLADKQASLDRIAGGVLVVDEAGEIAIKPGADEQQTANAQKVLAAIPGGTYQGFSEEVRRMKDQPARTGSYLESLKSELATLKARRNAQVSALSKSPRLSTGKMALLDHPILRVAGFREAPPMRLLKWAGRPEQPPVAAAEPAAPVAAAGDETMPEFERQESPGVYVIPGIVKSFERKIERLRDAKTEAERMVALDVLQRAAKSVEGFPGPVKKALGPAYASIEGYAALDREVKGGLSPEWASTIKGVAAPDPALAESIGTVADMVGRVSPDKLETEGLEVTSVLALLGHGDSLGDGAISTSWEEGKNSAAVGSVGDKFYAAFLGDIDTYDGRPEDVIALASDTERVPRSAFGEDQRYGTYDFTFERRPDIAGPPAEKAPEDYMDPVTRELHQEMVSDESDDVGDVALARAGGIQEDYSIPGLTAGTVPPPTPAVTPAAPPPPAVEPELTPEEEEAAMVEAIDLGKGPGPQVTPPVKARVSRAGEAFDPDTRKAVGGYTPPPITPAAEPPATPAAEAEDPTRKEFADLIAKDSLTDEEYSRAGELALDSAELDVEEGRSRIKELKARHPRGAPVEPPATTEVDEPLIEAFRQPAPPPPPTTPPVTTAASPDLQFKESPAEAATTVSPGPVKTVASPDESGTLDEALASATQTVKGAVKETLIAATKGADQFWSWYDSLGLEKPSGPVAEAVPAKPKEPSAADVTFKPESSDIKLDFAEMELPRKQVEATKIILKKFKASGLSDNMAKAAIINGLAESQLDTFASLQEGKKDNSYGIWQFNDVPGAAGEGMPHENLTDPYWMTDKMIEVIKATTQKPYGDDVVGLSRWITTNIENPQDAKAKAVNRPKRYGKEADKIIKEARAELALETTSGA